MAQSSACRPTFCPDRSEPDADELDPLAHALCGCYVLSMPSGALARLLASLLAAECDGEDET